MRITAQLIDVATGSHIWAERYDRNIADVFAVQDEITEAIVGAIEPQLYAAENFRAQRKAPDSMDAWDLVMRGLSHYWRLTRQDNMVAQALLEKATAIDPTMVKHLACLPRAIHSARTWAGRTWRPRCSSQNVLPCAAIRADSEDPWAHHALGNVHLSRAGSMIRSPIRAGSAADPDFSLAQAYYGLTLSYCGAGRTPTSPRVAR